MSYTATRNRKARLYSGSTATSLDSKLALWFVGNYAEYILPSPLNLPTNDGLKNDQKTGMKIQHPYGGIAFLPSVQLPLSILSRDSQKGALTHGIDLSYLNANSLPLATYSGATRIDPIAAMRGYSITTLLTEVEESENIDFVIRPKYTNKSRLKVKSFKVRSVIPKIFID